MVRHLYSDFLKDKRTYSQLEGYWRNLWSQVLFRTNQEQEWTNPWLNTSCVDGSRLMDGDPIFSAWCPERRLGVRIVQYEPRSSDMDLNVAMTTFDPDYANIKVLEVFCALSKEAARTIQAILISFVIFEFAGWFRQQLIAGPQFVPMEEYTPPVVNPTRRMPIPA
jgi:hypothetical protein